jgi:hypothetical protein
LIAYNHDSLQERENAQVLFIPHGKIMDCMLKTKAASKESPKAAIERARPQAPFQGAEEGRWPEASWRYRKR